MQTLTQPQAQLHDLTVLRVHIIEICLFISARVILALEGTVLKVILGAL